MCTYMHLSICLGICGSSNVAKSVALCVFIVKSGSQQQQQQLLLPKQQSQEPTLQIIQEKIAGHQLSFHLVLIFFCIQVFLCIY